MRKFDKNCADGCARLPLTTTLTTKKMAHLSDIKPITYLKANAAELLKYINETHRPIIITQNGEAKAVLQDPESYESMRKALSLLKLVSMSEEEVRQSKVIDNESVFNSIEKKLKNHEKKDKNKLV